MSKTKNSQSSVTTLMLQFVTLWNTFLANRFDSWLGLGVCSSDLMNAAKADSEIKNIKSHFDEAKKAGEFPVSYSTLQRLATIADHKTVAKKLYEEHKPNSYSELAKLINEFNGTDKPKKPAKVSENASTSKERKDSTNEVIKAIRESAKIGVSQAQLKQMALTAIGKITDIEMLEAIHTEIESKVKTLKAAAKA